MGEPCDRDTYAMGNLAYLIGKHNIDTVVETGVRSGSTTLFFANLVSRVYGVDLCISDVAKDRVLSCMRRRWLASHSVTWYEGDSQKLMPVIVSSVRTEPVLFYLDAHDSPSNPKGMTPVPLLGELQAIASMSTPPVVVVHDCAVPEEPEHICMPNAHNGGTICYDFMKEILAEFHWNWRIEYNSFSRGKGAAPWYDTPSMGVAYILPC